MNKNFKIILIVVLSLLSIALILLIAFYSLVYLVDKENDKLVKQYENKTITISDVEKLDEYFAIDDDLKSLIKSCNAFFTPKAIVFTAAQSYYVSGELTVTKDYYDKLLKEYDDWKLFSGIQQFGSAKYSKESILTLADDNFLNFIQNEEYFYSEKLFNSKGWLILFSQENGKIYFFINS